MSEGSEVVHRALIERIKIICASNESLAVQNRLEHDNYDVKRSGPIRISATRVDTSRHLIVAEREIDLTDDQCQIIEGARYWCEQVASNSGDHDDLAHAGEYLPRLMEVVDLLLMEDVSKALVS